MYLNLLSISHKYAMYYANLIFLDLSAVILFGAVNYVASHYENISTHFLIPSEVSVVANFKLPQVILLSSVNYRDQHTPFQETGKNTY